MDEQRFDAALRALRAGTTRRAGLAGALGVLLGGAITSDVEGKQRKGDTTRTCSKTTCPDGCCDGTNCQRGTKDAACGTRGKACETCGSGKSCRNQQCRTIPCTAASCPNGCCSGTTCVTATSAGACGTGGAACASCSCTAPICASGACVECASNADCSGATPVCDSGSCHALPWGNSAQFGSVGQGNSNIDTPYGVVVSADMLTAWVTDFGNSRIASWTRPNTTSTTWTYSTHFGSSGSGNDNFQGPFGVFVSADTRTVWVADSQSHRIAVWTRPDTSSTTWSYNAQFGSYGSGNDNFSYPYGIFVSADTLTAWVADLWNNRIAVWTRPTMSSTTWSYSAQFGSSGSGNDNFSGPRGIAVSADTLTAWVADSGNSRIAVWTRADATSTTWSPSTQFGSDGSGDDKFQVPGGVFVSADTLTTWVADTGNNRIAVWSRSDATSTTWSSSTRFGTGPGSGDSNFYSPNGVFVSADTRTAWVADGQNSRISIWTHS